MHEFSIKNPMAPLWLTYPHIPNGSIGWRMGYGEYYLFKLGDWLKTLSDDERNQYKDMFPAPKQWSRSFVKNRICFWNYNGTPEYSIKELLSDFSQRKELDFLFFYGHTPSKDGNMSKSCFSQWWKSEFRIGIYKYFCMEQYMMAEKARLFEDAEIEELIMKCDEPSKIKKLGRKVRNFNNLAWDEHKYSIVLNGNYAKFMQNEELREFLINTGSKILVEASPYDKIWGIGMSEKDMHNPNMWKGQNLLGFALMEVREDLKRVCQNYDIVNWQAMKDREYLK